MNENICNFLKKNISNKFQNSFLYQSKFSICFPKYQEKYIKEYWTIIKRILSPYGVFSKLDVKTGSIDINTTTSTKDPFIIFKARDFVKLISRSVPINQAAKIFDDEIYSDIIKITGIINNRTKFLKRRKRLIGTNGTTIKAIEMATNCYIMVQGNTVSCMGKHYGIKQVRKIILNCFRNIHPVIHIKTLMIKNELLKDERFKNQTWEKFLPCLEKKNLPIKIKNHKKKNDYLICQNKIFYEPIRRITIARSSHADIETEFLKSYSIISSDIECKNQ